MNGFEKCAETKLPKREDFYSLLREELVSYGDYEHAWSESEMKAMGDYHDLYLKTDVLLLADVFEEFRNVWLKCYGLDPCLYFNSCGLS